MRLASAGFVLARYNVALPAQFRRQIPAPVRLAGAVARFVSGPSRLLGNDNATRIASALIALGPAWVKLGQFLATRPDILGPDLTSDLRFLQDKMPPFAQNLAIAAIERELDQ